MTREAPRQIARAYDESAAGYDSRLCAATRSLRRLRRVEAPLRRLARDAERILDLGCGTGRLMVDLARGRRIGVDLSLGMLHEARRKGLAVACADAHVLPFADGAFQLVTAANAVFRYLRLEEALAEAARVLAPGGRLALHQYAARVWTPRRPFAPPVLRDPRHLEDLHSLGHAAAAQGLRLASVRLWRGLRFWPYAVPIPRVIASRLWDHGLFVFEKLAVSDGPAEPRAASRG
jgi:SAM-dependent methyltransferase